MKIKFNHDTFFLDEKLECIISGSMNNDEIEIITTIVDEGSQTWKSHIKTKNNSDTFHFTIDDIMLNMEYNGIRKNNIIKFLFLKIYECLNKKVSKNHFFPKFIKFTDKELVLEVSVKINGQIRDKRDIKLISHSNKMKTRRISQDFEGKFYYQEGKIQPGILIIAGSMGDFYWCEQVASLLSHHGYSTLALSYFSFRGLNNLPRNLINIPLEYFKKAMEWLKTQDEVLSDKIGVMGLSKGAEAALLLGSYFSDAMQSIMALSPPSHSFEGVYLGKKKNQGSWSINQKGIDFLDYPDKAHFSLFMKPGYLNSLHTEALKKTTTAKQNKARIKVEKIKAHTLLVSGEKDMTWPSTKMCQEMKEMNPKLKWLNLPEAGHIFNVPNIPPILESGTQSFKENYIANQKVWELIISFFKETLK